MLREVNIGYLIMIATQPLKTSFTGPLINVSDEYHKRSQKCSGIKKVRYLKLAHNDVTAVCSCRCVGYCSCDCDRKTF